MNDCFVKFYWFNLVSKEEATITSSSINEFFPVSNLKDDRLSKVTRSINGEDTLALTFDLATTEEVDSVLIHGGLSGFGFIGNVIIKANPTDATWGAPAFQTTLTPDNTFNRGIASFDAEAYRFWRIEVSSPGADFVEVAKVFIGKKLMLETNNIDFGWSYKSNDLTRFQTNRFGERFIDRNVTKRAISASYKILNTDEFPPLLEMFNYCGKSIPVWMVVDSEELFSDNKHRFMIYGYFKDVPDITNTSFALYDLNFEIEE